MSKLNLKSFISVAKTSTIKLDLDNIDFSLLDEYQCIFQNPDSKLCKGLYLLPNTKFINTIKNAIVVFNLCGLSHNSLLNAFYIESKHELKKIVESEEIQLLIMYNTMLLTQYVYNNPQQTWNTIVKKFAVKIGFVDES